MQRSELPVAAPDSQPANAACFAPRDCPRCRSPDKRALLLDFGCEFGPTLELPNAVPTILPSVNGRFYRLQGTS